MFSLFPEVIKELDIKTSAPATRDGFHLGNDDAALRQRVRSAGFDGTVVLFHTNAVIEAISAEDYVETFFKSTTPRMILESLSADDRARVREAMLAKVKKRLDNGEAIGLDTIVIIATKAARA